MLYPLAPQCLESTYLDPYSNFRCQGSKADSPISYKTFSQLNPYAKEAILTPLLQGGNEKKKRRIAPTKVSVEQDAPTPDA